MVGEDGVDLGAGLPRVGFVEVQVEPRTLGDAPDTGEAGAQVDAVLADHARLTEGTP